MYAGLEYVNYEQQCPLCGWQYGLSWTGQGYGKAERISTSEALSVAGVQTEFSVSSPEVELEELGTHLKTRFSDVYSLEWWRFEELMADVFRAHGHTVLLTRRTKDNGADIVVYEEAGSGKRGIVQCKKYAAHRRLGVDHVDRLYGTAARWGVRSAWLVTTSVFTRGASQAAGDLTRDGFELELVDAADVLSLLNVYNANLPRLHEMSDAQRAEIIASNRQYLARQQRGP